MLWGLFSIHRLLSQVIVNGESLVGVKLMT